MAAEIAVISAAVAACTAGSVQACHAWQKYRVLPDSLKKVQRFCEACKIACACGNCTVEINSARDELRDIDTAAVREKVDAEVRKALESAAGSEALISARANRIIELIMARSGKTPSPVAGHGVVSVGAIQLEESHALPASDSVQPGVYSLGTYTNDCQGRVLEIDETMAEITSMNVEAMRESGFGWVSKLHPSDFKRTVALWLTCAENKWTFAAKYRFLQPYTTNFCFSIARPVFDGDTCTGFSGRLWQVDEKLYNELKI